MGNGYPGYILLIFNSVAVFLSIVLIFNAFQRMDRVKHTLALATRLHADLGEGAVWAQWPKDKQFPEHCWWFEKLPSSVDADNVWPYGVWPSENNSTDPPMEMVQAAAEEMKQEMPKFMSLLRVIGVMVAMLVALIVVVAILFD